MEDFLKKFTVDDIEKAKGNHFPHLQINIEKKQ